MTRGIFNPYKKKEEEPKKEKIELLDEIHLDGGYYVITFKNAALSQLPEKLGYVICELSKKYALQLAKYGIHLIPTGETYQLDPEESHLPTPYGHLCVYVGTNYERLEDEIFKRLGHAIYSLNDPVLTKRLGVDVLKRG